MRAKKMNMDAHFRLILVAAHHAAKEAVAKMGPENMNALDCGFAWVEIDGRHPFVNWCRKNYKIIQKDIDAETDEKMKQLLRHHHRMFGSKGVYRGWQFWCPGEFNGQAIGHHRAGAHAFNDVLAKEGIVGTVGSRYD
jgi:hypothetical protein